MKAASVLLVLLAGCASIPADIGFGLDAATTVFALTQTDLVEVGPLHQGQDVAVIVAIDALVLWGLHRAYKRWPDWPGWPTVWWGSGLVKLLVALKNLELILESER